MNLRPSHPVGQALGSLAEQVRAVPAQGAAVADVRVTGVTLRGQDAQRRGPVRGAARSVVARRPLRRPTRCSAARSRCSPTPPGVERRSRPTWASRCWSTRTRVRCSGELAATVYGHPSERLRVIGVTGTSGKTTTTYLVEAGLRSAERVAGLIGTVGIRIDGRDEPSALTTPEAPELQALLAVMVEQGVDTVVMEVSSHALTLGRVDGVHFAVGGFTNLSRDHLDFHPTMEDYFDAKARLFDPESPTHANTSVVCIDDDAGRAMARRCAPPGVGECHRARRGLAGRDTRAVERGGQEFVAVDPAGVHHGLRIGLPGRYNVANCLLAVALLDAVGVSPEQAAPGLRTATVPGRLRADRPRAGLPRAGRLRAQTRRAARGARDAARAGGSGQAGGGVRRRRQPRPGQARADGRRRGRTGRPGRGHRRQPPRRGSRRHPGGDRGRGDGAVAEAQVVEIGDRRAAIDYAVGWAQPGRRGADRRQGPRSRPDEPRADPAVRRPRRTGRALKALGHRA